MPSVLNMTHDMIVCETKCQMENTHTHTYIHTYTHMLQHVRNTRNRPNVHNNSNCTISVNENMKGFKMEEITKESFPVVRREYVTRE